VKGAEVMPDHIRFFIQGFREKGTDKIYADHAAGLRTGKEFETVKIYLSQKDAEWIKESMDEGSKSDE
jgi:hypothetical protein